ncbi:MAG: 50S ribosomal protein L28 [Parachlamydiaceae bacterium]|jgi:large subunit ribosomal protein L28
MSKECQVSGKKTTRGYTYSIRGIAKKKKGIGLKVTGRNKRCFTPNLQTKRLWLKEENRFVTIKLAASCLRTLDKDANALSKIVRKLRAQGQTV